MKTGTAGVGKAIGLASLILGSAGANAQQASPLPPVSVDAPAQKKHPRPRSQLSTSSATRAARRTPAIQTQPAAPAVTASGTGGASPNSTYNPGGSGISRIPTSVLNTPQAITVVPRQLMDDQQSSTVVEALHNVPGISFFGGEGGSQGDNINIYGYSARNDFYRDGIRDPGWYTRDNFSVDNIEVLKGPSSFTFGRGSTGGVVNMTSKLPKFGNDFTNVDISAYSSPGARTVFDVNRSWGNVAARVAGVGLDSDVADRDHVQNKRVGVAPSLSYKFSNDTRATFSYIYQHDENVPDYGIPIIPGSFFGTAYGQPAPVSKNTFFGTVNDYERVDAHIATLSLEHDLSNNWKINNDTRYSNIDRYVSVRGTQVSGATGTNLVNAAGTPVTLTPATNLANVFVNNGNYFQNHTQNSLLTNLTGVTGRFDTGPFEHTISTGIELNQETRDQFRQTYAVGTTPSSFYNYQLVNVLNPDPFVSPGVPAATGSDVSAVGRGVGVYFGDQVKINQYLDLLAGIRQDYLSVSQDTSTISSATLQPTGVPATVINSINFTSYRAGAVVHPVQDASVYFMYGTSFDPSSEYLTITNGQQNLPPTTNETYQVGGKYDMFNHRLSLTGGVFRVTQNNAIETVNAALNTYAQVGTTRVDGVELGIAGKLTEKWSVFGGYTYMVGRVLESVRTSTGAFANTPGNAIANVPYNTFSLSSNYAITEAFTVGGSAFYTGDRWTSAANTAKVPDYWRYDAMASYKVSKQLTLQANIWNILNTTNFESLSGFGAAQPGPGRTFILTAKLKL
ncbi:MAG: TonB-dependent siderophore receptor [Tardiphaga sp.]